MRQAKSSEDVATEPYVARGDDASGLIGFWEKTFKRKFVFQKLVAVQTRAILNWLPIFEIQFFVID